MMRKVTLFPKCPACETVLEDATGVFGGAQPSPGAWSVCFYCAKLLRFDEELALRAATGEAIAELDERDKAILIRTQDAVLGRIRGKLKRPAVLPLWAKAWVQPSPPPECEELAAWVRSRPEPIKALMRRFPPQCLVRAKRVLKIPSPGHPGILYSYTEHGDEAPGLSVIDCPDDPGLRAVCEPGWLEPIGFHEGQTPEWVAKVLA